AHLRECAECRGYIDGLRALDARLPTAPPQTPRARRSPLAWIAPAAAIVAAAAGVALFVRSKHDDPPRPYIGAKGPPAVQVIIKRDEQTHIWDGRTPLRAGDAIAMRVACEEMTRVTVLVPQAPSGEWERLRDDACPADGLLPFTLRVDDAP